MLNLREPYFYAMAFMCRLHGREDCIHFKYDWVPIVYGIVTKWTILNWGTIPSLALKKSIEKVKNHSEKRGPFFYMASYLIDNVCAYNSFQGMGWNWNGSMMPIHE